MQQHSQKMTVTLQSLLPVSAVFSIVLLLCQSRPSLGLISPNQSTSRAFVRLSQVHKSRIMLDSAPLSSLSPKSENFLLGLSENATTTTTTMLFSSSDENMNGSDEESSTKVARDPVLSKISTRLRRANWISWWCQVILTVISSIILLFARSVLNAVASGSSLNSVPATAPGGFLFAGTGVVLSYLSIIWTWGGTRLARRLRRNSLKSYSRIKAATMIRRAIVIGTTLNLLGMLVTLIGAEQIVGLLAAKVLTMQGISPFQASFGLGAGGVAGGLGSQSVQPLDVLIVQANTNTLLSHFLSLVCCLILTRSVHVLDPPSVEDDER